jgi:hypothetical protein
VEILLHHVTQVLVIFLCTGYHWIFFHVVEPEKDTAGNLKSVSMEAREILEELNRDYKAPEIKEEEKKVADKFNAVSEFEMYVNCCVDVGYAI